MRVAYEYRVVCGASSALVSSQIRTLADAEHECARADRRHGHTHRIERRKLKPGVWQRVA